MSVKALILRSAGTNCDLETDFALRQAGAETQRLHINRLKNNRGLLSTFDILVIPGGFSYGDDLGAGTILANELTRRLKDPINKFIAEGKIIIGICNGFQVLVKAGLLPGRTAWKKEATLTINESQKFEDRWVYLKAPDNRSAVIKPGDFLYLPVAHAEGRLVCKDRDTLRSMQENGQVILRYTTPGGHPGSYPCNPCGSVDNIAGICDTTGRVIGMMPHPERFCLPFHHPAWTREGKKEEADGSLIFRRTVSFFQQPSKS